MTALTIFFAASCVVMILAYCVIVRELYRRS